MQKISLTLKEGVRGKISILHTLTQSSFVTRLALKLVQI